MSIYSSRKHSRMPEELMTPSPQANRLIASCLMAADDPTYMPTGFTASLDKCIRELVMARENFTSKVNQNGLLNLIPDEVQNTNEAFQAYAQTLMNVKKQLNERTRRSMLFAARQLHDSYMELNQCLISYEWAYLCQGEEPHPALNLMQKVIKGIEAGTFRDEQLDEVLDRLWGHFTHTQDVFANCEDRIRGMHGVQASRQVLAGIQDMDAYFDEHDIQILHKAYARLRLGCLMLVEIIQERTGQALADYPTPSPQINWVIHAARAVKDGLNPTLLQRALEWFQPLLSESYFRFEENAIHAVEAAPSLATQVAIARDGFDRLNRSLPLLRLGQERPQLLSKAISYLESAAQLLKDAYDEFNRLEEQEFSVTCPRCSQRNPASAKSCGACGAVLIHQNNITRVADEAPQNSTQNSNLDKILRACQEAEAGRLSREDFTAVMRWGAQLLQSAELGVSRLPQQTSNSQTNQAIEILRQGLDEFRAALEEMQRFIDDDRPVHLTLGSRLLIKAGELLAQLQQS